MFKKILPCVALTLSLQACIPVVFVAGASAGGAVIYDKRPTKTIIADRNISNSAIYKLNADQELKAKAHINVATFNSIVLMVGEAPTQDLKDRAFSLVSSVPGIKRVYNEISVEPPISDVAIANDSWLTTKVKSEMLGQKGLSSGDIKVITENGVVYLMGLTGRNQATLATEVARQVSGVAKVVTVFEYD